MTKNGSLKFLAFGWTLLWQSAFGFGLQAPIPNNQIKVTIGGDNFCGKNGYINELCTEITICVPGTSDCQNISGLLVDTGSVGVRIFKSVLEINLPPVAMEGPEMNQPSTEERGGDTRQQLAECVVFSNAQAWGPVHMAEVILSEGHFATLPIQLIQSSFALGKIPEPCNNPSNNLKQTPEQVGYRGILGIGVFKQDCGIGCSLDRKNRRYFSCSKDLCENVQVSQTLQVSNPISNMPVDNNGAILNLPDIPLSGADSIQGKLILGIDTQNNNRVSLPVQVFWTDSLGAIATQLDGHTYLESYIDSGSNGIYFPDFPLIDNKNIKELSAVHFSTEGVSFDSTGALSHLQGQNAALLNQKFNFSIGNRNDILNSNQKVSRTLGGEYKQGFFWGIPFFLGRKVYLGIESKLSSLGLGPYYAY